MTAADAAGVRIGELAARTGVSTHVLRAWENRYRLLRPTRTYGGYRLYGPDDERRVREVLDLRAQGVSAGEAAARVLAREHTRPGVSGAPGSPADMVARLIAATLDLDDLAAEAALDDAFGSLSLPCAIRDVVMRFLDELGVRWATGEISVAHEHFASGIVRRRLMTLAPLSTGSGPVAVLACPAGERHDIALLALALLLGRAGWRVKWLGADTPLADVARACQQVQPALVLLSATRETAYAAALSGITYLARRHRVALGGHGATDRIADLTGALRASGDIVETAELARELVSIPARARPVRAPAPEKV